MTVVDFGKPVQAVHRIHGNHVRDSVWPVEPEIMDDATPEPVVLDQCRTEDCSFTQPGPEQRLFSSQKTVHAGMLGREQLTRGEHLLRGDVGDCTVKGYSVLEFAWSCTRG